MRPYELMMCGSYAAGMTVLDALSDESAEKLGLHLVEGDVPGRDFMGSISKVLWMILITRKKYGTSNRGCRS